jgi:TPR repeat protein
MGMDGLINWSVLSSQSAYTDVIDIVGIGPFSFELMAPRFQIVEFYTGGPMPESGLASGLGMTVVAIAATVYLTAVSYFKRFWYLLGVAAMMGFMLFLHPETAQLFGLTSKPLLILFFLVLFIPSYYIHAFYQNENIAARLFITTGSVLVLAVLVKLFATIDHPFSAIFNYGLLAPLFITLVFSVIVSHEIIRVFLKVTTSGLGTSGRNRLRHFLILTLLYWVNILITYLQATHVIDWNIIYLDPYVLISISALLGFWGLHKRAVLYDNVTGLNPVWLLTYLSLGIVSFTFMAYLMLGVNDPLLKVVGDFIIYSHLAIGMAFLLYVVYNFMPVIEQGYDVEKVLYKPTNLPYLTYRLVGILGIVALIAMRGLDYPVWYSLGGYYNAIADHHKSYDDPGLARVYYTKAADFAHNNHKANYNLGLLTLEDNVVEAKEHYTRALRVNPSGQAYVNLANVQEFSKEYFKSLFTLQEGIQALPNNRHVANNLAVQFERAGMHDSAFYYLDRAGNLPTALSNRIAMSAKYGKSLGADSALMMSKLLIGGKANATNLGVFEFNLSSLKGDYMFDKVSLNNWLLSGHPAVLDSTLYQAAAIVDSTLTPIYKQELSYALSIAAYRSGAVNEGITRLQSLIAASVEPLTGYNETLGLFYMSVGAYESAIDPLRNAEANGSETAAFKLAVALSELGNKEEAVRYWEKLTHHKDDAISETAQQMKVLLQDPGFEYEDDDYAKYLFMRYNRQPVDEIGLLKVAKAIMNDELKGKACLDMANYYLNNDNEHAANLFLALVPDGLTEEINRERQIVLMRVKALAGEPIDQLYNDFIASYSFPMNDYLRAMYFQSVSGAKLDSTAYLILGTKNAFYVDGILAAADYFKDHSDAFKSYNIIVDALYFNQSSPRLLQAYVITAARLGFDDYAEDALLQYSQKFPGPGFNRLVKEYEAVREQYRKLIEPED